MDASYLMIGCGTRFSGHGLLPVHAKQIIFIFNVWCFSLFIFNLLLMRPDVSVDGKFYPFLLIAWKCDCLNKNKNNKIRRKYLIE